MIFTPDDAANHDCIGPQNCGMPVDKDNKTRRVCKGPACGMAWRWGVKAVQDPNYPPGVRRVTYKASTTHGYCGLAGDPATVI